MLLWGLPHLVPTPLQPLKCPSLCSEKYTLSWEGGHGAVAPCFSFWLIPLLLPYSQSLCEVLQGQAAFINGIHVPEGVASGSYAQPLGYSWGQMAERVGHSSVILPWHQLLHFQWSLSPPSASFRDSCLLQGSNKPPASSPICPDKSFSVQP